MVRAWDLSAKVAYRGLFFYKWLFLRQSGEGIIQARHLHILGVGIAY